MLTMTTHSDFLIGRIALERGLVSVDQLAECLGDQKAAVGGSLGTIMLRRGLEVVRPARASR